MENQDLIYIDDLTGLYNRRAFRKHLEKYLASLEERIQGLFLALTDLDHFKKINDTYGHLSGDYLIREYSNFLAESLRGTDSIIARYGGDEFVIIMRKISRGQVVNIWDKIREELSGKEFVIPQKHQKISITMSIGISVFPSDGKTADDLFSKADEALYSSKQLGRNRVSLAKDILDQVKEEKRVQNTILKPPFAGREKEFQEIQDFLFCEEPHKLVLIDSDVGLGKSRMLEETRRLAQIKGTSAFLLACSELQRDKPYGLVADIVNAISYRHYELCKKAFDSLKQKQKMVLSTIPALKILAGGSETISNWNADMRSDLFYGMAELFEDIVNKLKPVILIDNLDGIDEASTGVMSYIIVSKKEVPLRLCACDSRLSDTEQKRASFLDTLLYEISEFEIVPRISLTPLSESLTGGLVKSIFPNSEVPQTFLNDICSVTKGNPFFATELLRDLLSKGAIRLKYPEWTFDAKKEDLPHDLRELLTNKFENLGPEEKELLLAAAGIGGNLKFDFLSKLKKINNGYLQDIIGRTADKNIFKKEEMDIAGTLSFRNEVARALFYESADAQTKKKLHLDIATELEKENKDDIEAVSSELAFHFGRADLQTKVKEYAGLALGYVDKLFSDAQTEKIIEDAIRERETKGRLEPIKAEAWPIIGEVISSLNSAAQSMHIYQTRNDLTDNMIDRCITALDDFFKIQNNLTFSAPQGEAKDTTRLLVNGQDFSCDSSSEQMISKRLIDTMREFDIGSITFSRKISKNAVEAFVHILSNPKLFAEKKENWRKILTDNKISAIHIDSVIYKRVLLEEEKKQFRRDLIKDLAVEKAAMGNAGPATEKNVINKKIQGVTSLEKNVFEKTIAQLPIDVIVQIIANEYARRKNMIVDIKDMVSVCLKNRQEKNQFIALLQEKLQKLGISKESFEWLIDEANFLQYPIKKRANIYLNTDAKTLLEIGVPENLKPTLAELFGLSEKEAAEKIIDKFLSNFQSAVVEFKTCAASGLPEIINTIPAQETDSYMKKITAAFLESLRNEKDPDVYEVLAKNTGLLVRKLQEPGDYEDIDKILSLLQDHKKSPGELEWRKTAAEKALAEVDLKSLDIFLVTMMDGAVLDKEKNGTIMSMFKKLMPQPIPYLLDLLHRRPPSSVSFECYLQDLQVMGLLKEYKPQTLVEIEKMLDDENKISLAFDILNSFRDEGLISLYEKALNSKKKGVRKRAIQALIELDTDASFRKTEDFFVQTDPETQKSIICAMGEYSHSGTVLNFLLKIRDLKNHLPHRKEIHEAIEKIEKRTAGQKSG